MLNSVGLTFIFGGEFLKYLRFLSLFLALPSLIFAQTMPVPAAPTATAVSADAPKVFCAHPNFDFHNVDEGGDITHLFRVVNRGKSTLKITNISTSCGCTAAALEKNGIEIKPSESSPVEIPAGGRGVVKATYHTKGRPGHATKIITVTSNDPVNPGYQMKLDMTVVRDIDIQPDRVYLYNVQHGQAQTSTIHIMGKPHLLLKILSAQSTNNTVGVSIVSSDFEKATHRYGATLQVSLPATQPIGSFSDTIKVQTSYKKKPELDIDVAGEVVGKFVYSPHSVSFGTRQDNALTVSFTPQDPQNFTIRKVESLHHLARPEMKKFNYGGGVEQYQVLVYPPKNIPANSDGTDKIVVTTNDVEQGSVTIDVQVAK
jgi:hypothetical protein